MNNGINGKVKVIHTPNHRGCKGTEYLIKAVNELKESGLLIELILLEKVSNSKVRELMQEADILAEQFYRNWFWLKWNRRDGIKFINISKS